MKCQSCGKKEATVRYVENINGKKQEIHLCIDCANKLGFADFSNMFSPIFSTIPSFFEDLTLKEEEKCPSCGYTFENYADTGLFGCPVCYDTFSDKLDELFLKLHGKNRHPRLTSKKTSIENTVEKKLKDQDEIENLKQQLNVLVKNEEYEKAAVLRDKIKEIENNKQI